MYCVLPLDGGGIGIGIGIGTDLGWLANLLADDLPLLVFVFLDGVEQRLALIFGKLCVVHILEQDKKQLCQFVCALQGENMQGLVFLK